MLSNFALIDLPHLIKLILFAKIFYYTQYLSKCMADVSYLMQATIRRHEGCLSGVVCLNLGRLKTR